MTDTKTMKLLYYGAVLFILIFILGPILWALIISLTPETDILKAERIVPDTLFWDNYKNILNLSARENKAVLNALTNSTLAAAVTLALAMPSTVLAGYALARYDFPGKGLIQKFILITIIIPVSATIIPIYSIFRTYDLLDSLFWTSVIYTSSALPLTIWIAMNYFKQLPQELWQAAAIDGFTERQMFLRILLPLSQPVLLTVGLIIFLMTWKQFMVPSILLSSYDNRVITMAMSEFMTKDSIQNTLIAACGIIAIIPPAISAVIFRKYLISGLTAGTGKTL